MVSNKSEKRLPEPRFNNLTNDGEQKRKGNHWLNVIVGTLALVSVLVYFLWFLPWLVETISKGE